MSNRLPTGWSICCRVGGRFGRRRDRRRARALRRRPRRERNVPTDERRDALIEAVRATWSARSATRSRSYSPLRRRPNPPMTAIRIAAVGDLHLGVDSVGSYRPCLDGLHDVTALLLAGDLTRLGTKAEAMVVADELRDHDLPVVAVLGNHDVHSGREADVVEVLAEAGIEVLDGTSAIIESPAGPVAIAGVKGFGIGFPGASASCFGEPVMKELVRVAEAGGRPARPGTRPGSRRRGGSHRTHPLRTHGRNAPANRRRSTRPRVVPARRGHRSPRRRPRGARARPSRLRTSYDTRRCRGAQRRMARDSPALRRLLGRRPQPGAAAVSRLPGNTNRRFP